MGVVMDNKPTNGKTIIGTKEFNCITLEKLDNDITFELNRSFWDTVGEDILGNTSLPNYGTFISEEKHGLFRDINKKKVLEIGCGTGRSLQYLGLRGASELWGLDISETQIEKAQKLLKTSGLTGKFINSPMEIECGIPTDYFDYVYSIYSIGWTTNLCTTFSRIYSYLKKGGVFIFSWSHPIHKCVTIENGTCVFAKPYFDESWYSLFFEDTELRMSDRKLSTYVNALSKAGFFIEEIIEETDEEIVNNQHSEFANKAKILPVTFVIKASKR